MFLLYKRLGIKNKLVIQIHWREPMLQSRAIPFSEGHGPELWVPLDVCGVNSLDIPWFVHF